MKTFAQTEIFPLGRDKHLPPGEIEQFKVSLCDWVNTATTQGWSKEFLYGGHDRSFKLSHPEGWVAHVILRDEQLSISVWRPDGNAVVGISEVYSMEALRDSSIRCHYCFLPFAKLRRVGFANQACDACLPKARNDVEYPGWCD
jgi:hypothetical protein